jgi:uncharacterized protein (DUF885 family)
MGTTVRAGLFDRRELLQGLGALAAASVLPATTVATAAADAVNSPSAATTADTAVESLLAALAEQLLVAHPESAAVLGIDKGARAGLKSRLTDRSPEGVRREAAQAAALFKKLEVTDRARLSSATRLDLEVVETAYRLALDGYRFPFGDVAILNSNISYRNSPYVVAQNTGAFVEVPDFLDSHHRIESPQDAESYVERLAGYAQALDGETERLRHDGAAGVILPTPILNKTLHQLSQGRAIPIPEWGLVRTIVKQTIHFSKDYAARATVIATTKIAPALDRQIAALTQLRPKSTSDAGVWGLPDGEAYYAWALRAGTTTNLTPAEVHQLGLDQLNTLHARMEPLLRAQGLTQGTPGERMGALGKDPRNLYPDTEAGRTQILDYVNDRITDMRSRLPRAFATLVPGRLIVKRVPPAIEHGAPDGYAGPGTIDGSQPGMYYINLRTTSIWPRYGLPTLSYHEGIPGHVWQGEYTYRLPLIRSLLQFNSYTEGWALYAEQLGDELGVYDDDPLGRLGYLHSLAFRACRLVVDTGLHAMRWTRDQAIHWFATTNGSTVEEVQAEVDRYCVWPGQACGYKVGHSEINRLRERARTKLGARFDLRVFDDAVVKSGNVPLNVLERVVSGL